MLRNYSSEHVGALLGVTSAYGNALRRRSALLIGLLGLIMSACSSSTAKKQLSDGCVLNSDCSTSLVCSFGRCHAACVTSQDCPAGASCVKSSDQSKVCLLPAEASCSNDSGCPLPLVCGVDQNCRGSCKSAADCTSGQKCTNSKTCAEPSQVDVNNNLIVHNDAGTNGAGGASSNGGSNNAGGTSAGGSTNRGGATNAGGAPPGGSASLGGTTNAGGNKATGGVSNLGGSNAGGSNAGGTKAGGGTSNVGGSSVGGSGTGGQVGNSCPSPQTQFGFIAQGDSDTHFTSGVGVRTASELVVFDGYTGPDPAVVSDAASPPQVYYVYIQTFDPATAKSKGPAKPLFKAGDANSSPITIEAAAVAPTGEIILVYYMPGIGTSAAFLSNSPADAGVGALQVNQTVQIEVAQLGGQVDCTWSVSSKAFVCSWRYLAPGTWPIKIRKFLPDGRTAGGDTDEVPTDRTDNYTGCCGDISGSGNLFGVGYKSASTSYPMLTVLDKLGNQLGSSIVLQTVGTNWITVGGTSKGFVIFYDASGVAEAFVPVDANGGVKAATDADAGALSGFRISGTKTAQYGRAINDDVGGVGGVGLALLYPDSAAFAYVNSDGLTHVGPGTAIAHTYVSGDYININNFAGSFGLSLYSSAAHSTQMVATGCSP